MNPNTKIYNQGILLQPRAKTGKYKRDWSHMKYFYFQVKIQTAIFFYSVLLIAIGGVFFQVDPSKASTGLTATSVAIPEAGVKKQVYEGMLLEIIHNGETQNTIVKDGEIFSSFDPNSKMRSVCMRIGGKRPLDCESYGPLQEKLGTIQYYAPQVYGHTVTQQDAMLIANDTAKAEDFFLQCSLKVEGCVWNWTSANNNRAIVTSLIQKIRHEE